MKSDKNGEFTLDSVLTDDVLHINYKGKIQDVVVTDKSKIHLIVGKDNRIFEKETYTGESFHGTLLNHKGKGIRGAMVYASDPFDYVKSNRDGEFVLDNVHADDTIHVRYNDYIHDIAIDGSKGMYIIIGRSNGRRANDDRVRMGAGTMSVREYNGPLDVLTAERLEATGESSLYKALLRCPGIGTRYVNGQSRLSIRASNFDPLWVVDGVEMRSFPDLTVMEGKRVDILKDGAAYGTRGAGGVIDAAESSRYAVGWDGRLSFTRIPLSRCDFGIRGYKHPIAIAIGRVGQFRRVGGWEKSECVARGESEGRTSHASLLFILYLF